MDALQTIGKKIYKDAAFEIYHTNDAYLLEGAQPELYQLLYIDEGSVMVGSGEGEKSLFAPLVLCVNYLEPVAPVELSKVKGFGVFFKPEIINHALRGIDPFSDPPGGFSAERVLLTPFLRSGKGNPYCLPVTGPIRDRLIRMSANMENQLVNQPDSFWPCRGRSFFIEILMLMQSLTVLETEVHGERLPSQERIYPVLREMHLRYPDPAYRAPKLPRPAAINRISLHFAFRKGVGKTPGAYLRSLRCAVGANLLKDTMLELQDIARRCGYANPSEFGGHFRKEYGSEPLAWRALYPNPYG